MPKNHQLTLIEVFSDQKTNVFENTNLHKINKFMAHSAVWGHPPIQRQNTSSKTLTTEKLSKSSLRRCTKFGQADSDDERKIRLP